MGLIIIIFLDIGEGIVEVELMEWNVVIGDVI